MQLTNGHTTFIKAIAKIKYPKILGWDGIRDNMKDNGE